MTINLIVSNRMEGLGDRIIIVYDYYTRLWSIAITIILLRIILYSRSAPSRSVIRIYTIIIIRYNIVTFVPTFDLFVNTSKCTYIYIYNIILTCKSFTHQNDLGRGSCSDDVYLRIGTLHVCFT